MAIFAGEVVAERRVLSRIIPHLTLATQACNEHQAAMQVRDISHRVRRTNWIEQHHKHKLCSSNDEHSPYNDYDNFSHSLTRIKPPTVATLIVYVLNNDCIAKTAKSFFAACCNYNSYNINKACITANYASCFRR